MSLHQSNIAALRHLGAALKDEADNRRTRQIEADATANRNGGRIGDEEADSWTRSFSTAYQTLLGIGDACEKAANALQNDADALARSADK